jgi:predicted Zn-ribbon and HTH transcriptional regulator
MTDQTRRQQLIELLRRAEQSFESLRFMTGLAPRDLEAELRHVDRSVRQAGERLEVEPAECEACGYVFKGRGERRLIPPGRCPKCRSTRILDPLLSIVST